MSQLYLISPPRIGGDFPDLLAAALDAGEVAAFQLRLKDVDDDGLCRAVERLLPVTQARDVAFILNDRADLAVRLGCDGVHLGQEDLPKGGVKAARGLVRGLSLGVTCHASRHLAMEAAEFGADYVAFGAFFPTATKVVEAMAEVEIIAWWSEVMEVPCVAIGGIDAGNCGGLVAAGADFLAVSGAVWNCAAGPAAGVAAMLAAMG
ncbi:MAG: thiamine phosphate synthase [Acidiphilium sp.]|nr:thiamine phosphate synthase [Acidiphilium sp.]MDD4934364.1 thiamine phosphate synthase [Acidiphilium sp.]